VIRLLALAALLPACGPHMCLQAHEIADLCATHPFGPATGCDGVERPQTAEACAAFLAENVGICVEEYIECRDALRLARCGDCPPECVGLAGVCELAVEPTSG
jgi:hypothetical protein